jgi:glutamate N-acetyltransferase/amino-acid N-acetyltransferase
VPLPHGTIIEALPALVRAAAPSQAPAFAHSILTTDTRTKTIALREAINGRTVHMLGMAKGSGMIMPDMATMLAFIVTDAAVDRRLLAALLREETELSFNRICVDGDMSTNDTVLLMAGGASGVAVTRTSRSLAPFRAMLRRVMQELARMIVRDGEGATKLLRVHVSGGRSAADAKKAAMQVARSCLVKTAFFGEDFNWGRIIAAVGQSGAACRPERIGMQFNGIDAVRNGQAVPENRARLVRVMKKKDITLDISLRSGSGTCDVLTCDLSCEYVKINADYTT